MRMAGFRLLYVEVLAHKHRKERRVYGRDNFQQEAIRQEQMITNNFFHGDWNQTVRLLRELDKEGLNV
ncbi:hypothetical protein [Pseudomonas phage LUZ7]|uniref:Uncharacterized protein n=1 Tax=Pseudomonas phage LUZ7 TaxID=655097 RepID=C8ZKI9_9CAUD|nr:hypothetical protein PP-LUZ7_gp090 [Pseudomonas phage LUZ7]CAZ66231.1 hypothetical protein [Pseudomonas phage LUZ7]